MNTSAAKHLELDKILQVLESFTVTAAGRDLARELAPSSQEVTVRRALAETTEARRLVDDGAHVDLTDLPDVRGHLERIRIEDRVLEAPSLADLARLAGVAERAQARFAPYQDELPVLSALLSQAADLRPLRSTIEKAIDLDSCEVKDDATPELRSIRARLFKLRNRLRNILESYLRQRDSRKILQDQVITERNGRAVLPVKAECRSQLMGIVHGSSASGATLFIEPLSTVELNNDIVALEEDEHREVHKILISLTREARGSREEMARTASVLARLDLAQAKAALSVSYDGAEPQVVPQKTLRLVSARHPLLLPAVAERAGIATTSHGAVPVTFAVDERRNALVFTGPNTGGKTVALKTAGLLAFMAQSGLHVPASSESTFPIFRRIFADIGDEQSIGGSLSTFSAHLQNVVVMEQELEDPSLVILDEVGTGTDPAEGGALGTALVDHFRSRGALVLVSTHHGMIKTYATKTEGVGVASFQFDPATYEPTYRLVEGSSGRSLAFEVALRLGLGASIVRRARELQNEKERQVEELLQQLETDTKAIERDRARVAAERRALEEAHRRREGLDREMERRREQSLKSFHEELREELDRVREELRRVIDEARERSALRLDSVAETRQGLREVARGASEQIDAVASRLPPAPPVRDIAPPRVSLGEQVLISSLGLVGVVVETLSHDEVEVMVHDKKLRIPTSEVTIMPGGNGSGGTDTRLSEPHTRLPERKRVPSELNVIGCTVDEALSQADKFLDDAFLSDHRTVRLIHGLGKGKLQRALREWLAGHPHVAGHQSERSGAVTVVELRS